jgi:hypothetical protein
MQALSSGSVPRRDSEEVSTAPPEWPAAPAQLEAAWDETLAKLSDGERTSVTNAVLGYRKASKEVEQLTAELERATQASNPEKVEQLNGQIATLTAANAQLAESLKAEKEARIADLEAFVPYLTPQAQAAVAPSIEALKAKLEA